MTTTTLPDTLASATGIYDSLPAEYAAFAAPNHMGVQMDVFAYLVPPAGRVLDAGCGSGRDIAEFAARGYDVVGVDLSAGLLEIAARTRRPVHMGDLRNLPFSDADFDGVWACASLVHLNPVETTEALSEFRRVVRGNGGLFVTVKGGADAGGWEETSFGSRYFHRWQSSSLRAVVAEAGFAVTHTITHAATSSSRPDDTWIELYGRAV